MGGNATRNRFWPTSSNRCHSSIFPSCATTPFSTADENIQTNIDDIVAMSPPKKVEPKRKKVYCDKWVHDGVCAFTQQGCKFKHEMPMDRQTQHELGLFNGLPAWYRRQQGVELRAPTAPSASRGGNGDTYLWGGSQKSQGGLPSAPLGRFPDPRSRNQFELLNNVDGE